MINYEITIGYKAVITVEVKAKNEEEAKKLALAKFGKKKYKTFNRGINLQDDNYKVGGCLNMDETWNMYDK